MKVLTDKLRAGIDLTTSEVDVAVALLLSDETADEEKAGFLIALHRKGESPREIAAFVLQLMRRAVDPKINPDSLSGPMLDVCGTGGDGLDLFNISTTIMFILGAGGVVVVKHGNRNVTSRCGSADVLEKLGVTIDLAPEQLYECLQRVGVGFLFARQYHPAFRALAQMRDRLAQAKHRTIFNLLGPLLNPARPRRQLIGVFEARLTTIFAEVLRDLGRDAAWVVHGVTEDGQGMDDISISGPTTLAELRNRKVTTGVIDPRWLGIPQSDIASLAGADVLGNARILEGILEGSVTGPMRDLATVNAAAGFVVAGAVGDIREGIALAREQIDSRRALAKLRALQQFHPKAL
ncbi:MAG: anthranilate phosphoribosyltransferase [Chthoniobacterales bacterium]